MQVGGGATLDANSKIVNGEADLCGVIDLVATCKPCHNTHRGLRKGEERGMTV